jgi:hypothetical protein
MKNQIKMIAILLIVATGISQCKKDDFKPIYSNPTPVNVMSGTWEITLFELNGEEHTNVFMGYTFEFQQNGVLMAMAKDDIRTGKWSSDNTKFVIDLGTKEPFAILTQTGWTIKNQTSVEIDLEGKNGSDGTAALVFKKK